jgi:hypothetical protein
LNLNRIYIGEIILDKIAVVVTTAHRGVFFGFVDPDKVAEKTLTLDDCRCCIFWAASIGGFLGLASVGPNKDCRIGKAAPSVLLHDVTSVSFVSEAAVAAWKAA